MVVTVAYWPNEFLKTSTLVAAADDDPADQCQRFVLLAVCASAGFIFGSLLLSIFSAFLDRHDSKRSSASVLILFGLLQGTLSGPLIILLLSGWFSRDLILRYFHRRGKRGEMAARFYLAEGVSRNSTDVEKDEFGDP